MFFFFAFLLLFIAHSFLKACADKYTQCEAVGRANEYSMTCLLTLLSIKERSSCKISDTACTRAGALWCVRG